MPLSISIVMPVKNARATVAAALDSVRRQAWPSVQLVVVDARSTDGTLDALGDRRDLTLVSEPDSNPHEALNKGLKLATGDIVGFLNADDAYADGAFAAAAGALAARPDAGTVAGAAEFLFDDDRRRVVRPPAAPDGLAPASLLLGAPALNARFFRRALVDAAGPFDLAYGYAADRKFLVRCLRAGAVGLVAPATFYRYRSHRGSRTMNGDRDTIRTMAEEHVRLAEELIRDATTPAPLARAARRLAAFEGLKLLLRPGSAPRVAGGRAALVRRLFALDPVWAFRLPGAALVRRRALATRTVAP